MKHSTTANQYSSGSIQNIKIDCNNPDYQRTVAGNHDITLPRFNEMKTQFWREKDPEPVSRDWAGLNAMMNEHLCQRERWKLGADENDRKQNNITFEFELKPQGFHYSTSYSIELFRGIKEVEKLNDPDEFRFYKAQYPGIIPHYTVIIEIVRNKEVVNWYNLSNEQP